MGMIRNFLKNEDGNYAAIFAIAAFPIFGAVGISVDYSNLSRLNYNLKDSVDTMCSVVAEQYLKGATDDASKQAGEKFFRSNVDSQYTNTATVSVVLPNAPGNTAKVMKCEGKIEYKPIFGPVMAFLSKSNASDYVVVVGQSTMRMRNLAEIALVLDNSGSMDYDNVGNVTYDTSKMRMTLLKTASKKLVTDMISIGQKIQTANKPVQFSLVPFAQMVNVGPQNASASWIDTTGISPIHHENLDWGTKSATNRAGYFSDGPNGSKLDQSGNYLTRLSIYNALKVRTAGTVDNTKCAVWQWTPNSSYPGISNCNIFKQTNGTLSAPPTGSSPVPTKYTWQGCVEARPNGLDMTDAAPSSSDPKSLFVPSFAPDSVNESYYGLNSMAEGDNNWWPDFEKKDLNASAGSWLNNDTQHVNSSVDVATARTRETLVSKYYAVTPFMTATPGKYSQWAYFANPNTYTKSAGGAPVSGSYGGPNAGCTTNPITPLTDNINTLTTAIDNMASFGGTNAAEGLAWGWRTITPSEPFTGARPLTDKDVDRVVILLTDGANQLLEAGGINVNNRSKYSAYGLAGYKFTGTPGAVGTATSSAGDARVFQNSGVSSPDYTEASYQAAIDARMQKICTNIKNANNILMTVALDLDVTKGTPEQQAAATKAISELKTCAGASRSRKDSNGAPVKLFWNATSGTLDQTFKEIADELSNLRFTQ